MSNDRRTILGRPPMPVNANYYRTSTVPVCGIAALMAFCCVVGMAFGFILALIAL